MSIEFCATGVRPVDDLLCAVEHASRMYHDSTQWDDDDGEDQTLADQIDDAARLAAFRIESQAAEIDRLRALVEEAYREGYDHGHACGAADRFKRHDDEDWHDSDSRAALDADRNKET